MLLRPGSAQEAEALSSGTECSPITPPITPRSLCHAILDGMRWPGLTAHLAARYRQAVGGPPAEANELLHPIDRSVLSLEHYSRCV